MNRQQVSQPGKLMDPAAEQASLKWLLPVRVIQRPGRSHSIELEPFELTAAESEVHGPARRQKPGKNPGKCDWS